MIRLMQAVDVEAAAKIERLVQSHPWSFKQFQDAVTAYQSTVIEIKGQVAGFCILQPVLDEANLLLMAIDPAQQGQGLGYQLLEASVAMLKNNPVQIFLEVRESNQTAIKLYENQVFIRLICARIIILTVTEVVNMPSLW